jgi:hypothetical protein
LRYLYYICNEQNIKYIAPLDDLPKGITKNALSLQIIQNQLSTELKYMSLYYRLFNMNITQMKWSECHKKNIKTFIMMIRQYVSVYCHWVLL